MLTAAKSAWRARHLSIRPWQDLVHRTDMTGASLAVVGNAGYLAELDQGREIDGHDLVLRMNNFRTVGFERQVGHKLDVFFTSFHHDIDLGNPVIDEARIIATSVPFNWLKRRSVGLRNRHAVSISSGLCHLRRPEAFVPQSDLCRQIRTAMGCNPTTGAMAVMLAIEFLLPVCRFVYFTGFSFFVGPAHYFDDRPVVPRSHNPSREMEYVRAMLAQPVATGRVHLDPFMMRQLGFASGRARAA